MFGGIFMSEGLEIGVKSFLDAEIFKGFGGDLKVIALNTGQNMLDHLETRNLVSRTLFVIFLAVLWPCECRFRFRRLLVFGIYGYGRFARDFRVGIDFIVT